MNSCHKNASFGVFFFLYVGFAPCVCIACTLIGMSCDGRVEVARKPYCRSIRKTYFSYIKYIMYIYWSMDVKVEWERWALVGVKIRPSRYFFLFTQALCRRPFRCDSKSGRKMREVFSRGNVFAWFEQPWTFYELKCAWRMDTVSVDDCKHRCGAVVGWSGHGTSKRKFIFVILWLIRERELRTRTTYIVQCKHVLLSWSMTNGWGKLFLVDVLDQFWSHTIMSDDNNIRQSAFLWCVRAYWIKTIMYTEIVLINFYFFYTRLWFWRERWIFEHSIAMHAMEASFEAKKKKNRAFGFQLTKLSDTGHDSGAPLILFFLLYPRYCSFSHCVDESLTKKSTCIYSVYCTRNKRYRF